ncbi:MAG TPA: hypothetical protein VHX61_02920 [Rhizomicrobium sp.]|nr:hypothetical protein [Rhizomicrobium sp.]
MARMSGKSQRKATRAHRECAGARGFVRLEIQTRRADAGLIWTVAETLRGEPGKAMQLCTTLEKALVGPHVKNAHP